VRLQFGRANAEPQLLSDSERPALDDPVFDMDETDDAKGKSAVGHHRHV
jgi:hypothetical protein